MAESTSYWTSALGQSCAIPGVDLSVAVRVLLQSALRRALWLMDYSDDRDGTVQWREGGTCCAGE